MSSCPLISYTLCAVMVGGSYTGLVVRCKKYCYMVHVRPFPMPRMVLPHEHGVPMLCGVIFDGVWIRSPVVLNMHVCYGVQPCGDAGKLRSFMMRVG